MISFILLLVLLCCYIFRSCFAYAASRQCEDPEGMNKALKLFEETVAIGIICIIRFVEL